MELEYFPENHTYKINGILVPGATTITGMLPKPALVPWAAKETVTYLGKIWEPGVAYTNQQIAIMLEDAKKAHKNKTNKAADNGTKAHEWCEEYVKGQINGIKYSPPYPTIPEVCNSVGLFLQWVESRKINWLKCEVVVGSEQYMFAGRFDAIAEIEGVKYLVDFKTGSGIWYDYCAQLAGYGIGCEEMSIPYDERLILWIPKTGKKYKDYIVKTSLAMDKKCFLSALNIYHALQAGEKILKEAA